MDRNVRMRLLWWAMMLLLLLLIPMLCTSVRLGVPSGITSRAQGLDAASVSESHAASQVIVAAAGDVSSATPGDSAATTAGQIGISGASPAGNDKLNGKNRQRLLLDAQRDQQSNCTCACTMSCNNQPAPPFSMSCANAIDPVKITPSAAPTAKGSCGGEANKGSIGGFVGGILGNGILCFTSCSSFCCKLGCSIFMSGLSTAFGVASGCAQHAVANSACFPGDAAVAMANGRFKPMAALALGDKVAVRKRDGDHAFEDVIAQGHKDAVRTANFIRLTLSPVDANNISQGSTAVETRNLELTAFHFVPISTGFPGNALKYKRAKDVLEGDKLLVQPHPPPRRLGDQSGVPSKSVFSWYVVTRISQVTKQGLYNPFTPSGIIIVNGVVASTHSDWFLDGIFELFNAVHWLPAAYQFVLVPARMLYSGLGKDTYIHLYHWLDSRVDISELLSGRQHGLATSMILFCITVVIAIALGRKIAALLVTPQSLTTKQGPCVSAPKKRLVVSVSFGKDQCSVEATLQMPDGRQVRINSSRAANMLTPCQLEAASDAEEAQ